MSRPGARHEKLHSKCPDYTPNLCSRQLQDNTAGRRTPSFEAPANDASPSESSRNIRAGSNPSYHFASLNLGELSQPGSSTYVASVICFSLVHLHIVIFSLFPLLPLLPMKIPSLYPVTASLSAELCAPLYGATVPFIMCFGHMSRLSDTMLPARKFMCSQDCP